MDKKQSLGSKFDDTSQSPLLPGEKIKPVALPASKLRIDDLHKQLSEPRITAEFTPGGDVTRQVRTEHDQAVLKEIEAIRNRLSLRQGAAKQAFNHAKDGTTTRRSIKR